METEVLCLSGKRGDLACRSAEGRGKGGGLEETNVGCFWGKEEGFFSSMLNHCGGALHHHIGAQGARTAAHYKKQV